MNIDLETATLKAIAGEASVASSGVLNLVTAAGVGPEDFTHVPARRLFEAMIAQLRRDPKAQLDVITLLAALGGQVPRDYVVGVVTSGDLGQTTGRLATLKDASTRRHTVEILRHAAKMLIGQFAPVATIVGELRTALDGVVTSGDSIRPLATDIVGALDKLQAARRGETVGVIHTGIEAFDAYLGGLPPSVLTFIGSLPSVGKSALLASICRNLGMRRVKVGYLSLEDNRQWIIGRIASELSRVPFFVASNRPKELSFEQMKRYARAMEQAYPLLETVIGEDAEARPLTLPEVISRATSMVMQHGCQAIIVDHLGEISVPRTERHDLDVLEAAVALRSLAKTHHIAVVVAAHLRRRQGLMEKTDRPLLTDFAFSAGIERIARVALGLYRPSMDELRVVILKQTHGIADVEFPLGVNNGSATVKSHDTTGAIGISRGLYADAPEVIS